MSMILSTLVGIMVWEILRCFIPMLNCGGALATFAVAGFCTYCVVLCFWLKMKGENDNDD